MNGHQDRAQDRKAIDRGRPLAAGPATTALVCGCLLLAGCSNPDGLSWLSRTGLDLFLKANVLLGSHSGYVSMFARDGRVVHSTVAGYADIDAARPMTLDTRFRMASMTKPVTAVAALLLIEDQRLDLGDPVSRYIPEAAGLRVATSTRTAPDGTIPTEALARPLTVRDLLTFRAGIGSEDDPSDLGQVWAQNYIYAGKGTLADRVRRLLDAPLYEQPGTRWRYGWSADVLARVVEVAAAQPFDRFLAERVFEPLGMDATGFLPPKSERAGIARMYTQDENRNLVLVEEPASDAPDWTPGGSGLVSTAADYMRFALMLAGGGTCDGVRILAPETVELMTHAHVGSGVLAEEDIEGLGWGFGLAVVVDSEKTQMPDRSGDFWWSGYYGTTFFVSPSTGLAGVVLTQNQPGPYSPRPYAIYLAQAFAFWGS